MEKNKEWSNDDMFLLIDLYKEKPCLWDPTHKEYKLKTKRNDSWIEIANVFSCDITIIKKKIESLLSSFRRERQRCEETKKSGAGLDEIYSSTWFAFEKMKFLLDKFSPRPTHDTMNNCSETEENGITRDSDDSGPNTKKTFKSPNKAKRTKMNLSDQRAEEAFRIMQDAVERRNARDQSTTFGEHVANKHRSYNSRTKSIVEHLIANTLFEADIGKFENYAGCSSIYNYSQMPDFITQSPAQRSASISPTPTSPFPQTSPFPVIQTPSRTPTPTSTSTADQEPKLIKNATPGNSSSNSKKITVLRSLIIKKPNNSQIPLILTKEKYVPPEVQNTNDSADISESQNTDHLVSFINNYSPK